MCVCQLVERLKGQRRAVMFSITARFRFSRQTRRTSSYRLARIFAYGHDTKQGERQLQERPDRTSKLHWFSRECTLYAEAYSLVDSEESCAAADVDCGCGGECLGVRGEC